MKILFVEDDDKFAGDLSSALEKGPYKWEFIKASSIEAANRDLRLKSTNPYDVVVLDLCIPQGREPSEDQPLVNEDALSLIQKLRELNPTSGQIIAMTASSSIDQRAFSAGAEFCLRKPFATKNLTDVIENMMIKSDLKKQRRPVFVAHVFSPSEIDDLRRAIGEAFQGTPFSPYYADVEVLVGHILLDKVIDKIKQTEFGIYDISIPERANVFIELGIAIGLGRPYYLVARAGTKIPADLAGLDRIDYTSFSDLARQLKSKIVKPRLK